MLTQRQLLDAWTPGKLRGHFYRLASEVEAGFEYERGQWGHPSNYAGIRIQAKPSDNLSLDSTAAYPPSVSAEYAVQLMFAIGRAAIDEFFAVGWYPYSGCALVVSDVKWDDVMSSEVAMYRAARGALSEIRNAKQWVLVPVS